MLYEKQPCRRLAVAQDREDKNPDRPRSMRRAVSEIREGEEQRDNALQHPPVHPDCRASVQFRRSMTAAAIMRARATRGIELRGGEERKWGMVKGNNRFPGAKRVTRDGIYPPVGGPKGNSLDFLASVRLEAARIANHFVVQ